MTNKLGSANPNRIPKPKKKGKDTLDIYGYYYYHPEIMDSVKVTGLSTSLGMVYYTDLISGVLMCIMFAINIYYLILKAKKMKES